MRYQNIRPILLENAVLRYAYLLIEGHEKVLIDPGAKHHLPLLLKGLEKHTPIKDLTYIILQSNDYLNIASIEGLIEAGFKGTILLKETGIPCVKDIIKVDYQTIESLNFKLSFNTGKTLTFIPTPFLPFPENFATYFEDKQVLFSGHLGSQNPHDNASIEQLEQAVLAFHQSVMPSSEYLTHALNHLKPYILHRLYPRLGHPIRRDYIKPLLKSIATYDFYHTQQVIHHLSDQNRRYNYVTICNHMLKRLQTIYSETEIMSVFKGTGIKLEKTPILEIASTKLQGYKLWNTFFEIIDQKKGTLWLNLLEPIVRKYTRTYNIKLPSAYKSKSYEQKKAIEKLDAQKAALEKTIEDLNNKVKHTLDNLTRCPITKLYNEAFLLEYLTDNINKPLTPHHERGLLMIHIDNLTTINQKHGNKVGDETLRKLVYITDRHKQPDTLVFKQNGPGIVLYKHDVPEKTLSESAVKLRNKIQEATVFTEPVQVSISVVSLDEIEQDLPDEDKAIKFLDAAKLRIERAKRKGSGSIIDKDSKTIDYHEGIILLIDEDETYQNLMHKVFERIHYEVMVAKDIYDAYHIIESHNIDTIISEINLSKLDGFQLKRRLNESKHYKDIPFIIVSHHKTLDVIKRCNDLGVDAILHKPIIPEELTGFVKRFKARWRPS